MSSIHPDQNNFSWHKINPKIQQYGHRVFTRIVLTIVSSISLLPFSIDSKSFLFFFIKIWLKKVNLSIFSIW